MPTEKAPSEGGNSVESLPSLTPAASDDLKSLRSETSGTAGDHVALTMDLDQDAKDGELIPTVITPIEEPLQMPYSKFGEVSLGTDDEQTLNNEKERSEEGKNSEAHPKAEDAPKEDPQLLHDHKDRNETVADTAKIDPGSINNVKDVDKIGVGSNYDSLQSDGLKVPDGFTKGVILNPMQIDQPIQANWLYNSEKSQNDNNDLKLVQEYLAAKVPDNSAAEVQKKSEGVKVKDEEEKTEMTLKRKVVFGFSFLPSVLFVLCFAVILPCEDPPEAKACVVEKWSKTMNQTELTTDLTLLAISEGLLMGYRRSDSTHAGFMALDESSGNTKWMQNSPSVPSNIDCGTLDVTGDGVADCLINGYSGLVIAFNSSDGHMFWNASIRQPGESSSLPFAFACSSEDVQDKVLMAFHHPEKGFHITVMAGSDGSILRDIPLINCSTLPTQLVTWTHDNITDLTFFCLDTYDGSGSVWTLDGQSLCSAETDRNKEIKPELLTTIGENNIDTTLMPTDNGLLSWDSQNVILMQKNVGIIWSKGTTNHTANRFLEVGKFHTEDEQVAALVSGDFSSGTLVTLLNITDGKQLWTWSCSDVKVSTVIPLAAKDKDVLLLALLKRNQLQSKNSENISSNTSKVSPTINLLQSEKPVTGPSYEVVTPIQLTEELVILQIGAEKPLWSLFKQTMTTSCSDGVQACNLESQGSNLAASVREEDTNRVLDVVMSKSFLESTNDTISSFVTRMRSVQIKNWDPSDVKTTKCK